MDTLPKQHTTLGLICVLAVLASACGTMTPAHRGGGSTVEYIPLDDVLASETTVATGATDFGVVGGNTKTVKPWRGVVTERCLEMEPHLKVAAARFGVDVGLLAGIVYVESTFNPAARNRSGATGLMQVMPRNADRLDCGDLGD
ncbi:MAG: hypothetical protein ACI9MR_004998, partial [Myxococcota bacterium]